MSHTSTRHPRRYNQRIPVNGGTIASLRIEAGLSVRAFADCSAQIGDKIAATTLSMAEVGGVASPHMLHIIASVLTSSLGRDIRIDDLLKKDTQP
jgi:hypothetical protein